MNRSPVRFSFVFMSVVLICLALLPSAQAVTPAPDEAYAGGNTAEGGSALLVVQLAALTRPLVPLRS